MAGPSLRVAVLFGGPSPEHDVSVLTGLQAARALAVEPEVAAVHALYWTKAGSWFEVASSLEARAFVDGLPEDAKEVELVAGPDGGFVSRAGRHGFRTRSLEIDATIVCCHGGPGEDGSLQGTLDSAHLAYSGPTAAGAALGMDKLATTGVLAAAGVPTLPRVILDAQVPGADFPGPYIVKPRYGGSSIGIDVVKDWPTALARLGTNVHLRLGAVVEPYRDDLFDLQVAVRTWPETALSAVERPLGRGAATEILGYADKYAGGEGMLNAPRELPARIDPGLERELRETALLAARVLGARGVNRIDFLSDGHALYANEINTIPGSLARYLFIDPPLPFGQLLVDLVREAMERPAMVFSSVGADGSVLREAGSIAAKLA
jgi:D-alanine-D-alanine ligase